MGTHATDGGDPTVAVTTDWPGLVERPARGTGSWPDGVWAVLVHGTMDRGAGLAHLARRLRDAPTIRYDRRGYGRAGALPVGGLVQHIDDLVAIIDDRPVVAFGHSFGGLVVLGAAATGRLDVRGIATWEVPTPWIEGWTGWNLDRTADAGDVAEHFMRRVVGTKRWDALPPSTRVKRRAEGPALDADMDPTLGVGVPFDPARITARCVFGASSGAAGHYARGARWLADRIDGARSVCVADATHAAPMDRPDDVAALIRAAAGTGSGSGEGRDEVAV